MQEKRRETGKGGEGGGSAQFIITYLTLPHTKISVPSPEDWPQDTVRKCVWCAKERLAGG